MSLEVAVVRRAAPKMVVVWRGSLEEGGVLPMSLDVAMVWRASPEMVVVRCTALEEAVVQQTSPRRGEGHSSRPWSGERRWRWLWFGKGFTKWVDTMIILTENALETRWGRAGEDR